MCISCKKPIDGILNNHINVALTVVTSLGCIMNSLFLVSGLFTSLLVEASMPLKMLILVPRTNYAPPEGRLIDTC